MNDSGREMGEFPHASDPGIRASSDQQSSKHERKRSGRPTSRRPWP